MIVEEMRYMVCKLGIWYHRAKLLYEICCKMLSFQDPEMVLGKIVEALHLSQRVQTGLHLEPEFVVVY